MADDNAKIADYLKTQKDQAIPELAAKFERFEDLWSKKLWHQLSLDILEFVEDPPLNLTHFLSDFYKNFVSVNGKYFKPLTFVRIAILCNKGADFTTLMIFLEELPSNYQLDDQSKRYVQIERAHVYLTSGSKDPKVKGKEECLKLLKKSQLELQRNPEFDDLVHANYYRVLLQYDKLLGNHTSYYENAFKYMVHSDYDKISKEEKIILGVDLVIAGLGSSDIFCLDELLDSQLWKDVKGDEKMKAFTEILEAVNTGNITEFRKVCKENELPKSLSEPHATKVLEQKIRVTALMDLVFNLPLTERTVSFETVGNRCEIVITEVENMVMHALAKKLIGGVIDQVEQTIHFTHVKPRNLGAARIKNMARKTQEWVDSVESMEEALTDKTLDQILLASEA